MSRAQQYRFNISAPNLINICVDENHHGEISGRMYHCYSEEPVRFVNIVELIREAEKLFDTIAFPQASTKTRQFAEESRKQTAPMKRPMKVVHQEDVAGNAGELGTFITSVRFRQNSTWQGEIYWVEKEEMSRFIDILDFIKKIDNALNDSTLQKSGEK